MDDQNKERTPLEVARKISEIVPDKLKLTMEWYINDFSIKPPELDRSCWKILSKQVQEFYNSACNKKEKWVIDMLSILTNQSSEIVEEIQKYVTEENSKTDKPKIKKNIDYTKLKEICEGYIDSLYMSERFKDAQYYIFETAMITFYGKEIFDFINSRDLY